MLLPGVDCPYSDAPDLRQLEVTKTLGRPQKTRKTYALTGLAQGNEYGVFNNSLAAMECAVKERIFYVKNDVGDFVETHKPTGLTVNTLLAGVSQHFKTNVKYTTPWKAKKFAETYVGRKRTVYLKACESLAQKRLTRKDSYIRMFVKAEKVNFSVRKRHVPRAIQPRSPRFLVESGRYIKPIEKKIYGFIDSMFEATTIFKGLNAENRGGVLYSHWQSFDDPVAVGLDAKRFDQHVSQAMLAWEHSIYRMFYPGDKYFAEIMSWQLENTGFGECSDGKIKYKVKGCRGSGDMNTALGNCLIMSSCVHQYAKASGIKIRLANDGDDCVVIMERVDLEHFNTHLEDYFHQLGFSMTVEKPVDIFEEIEFCQSRPVYDGEKYIMVRDPRVAISKDCVALKPLDNKSICKMWCSAVGQGGMSLTGGIPVWQNFYKSIIKFSEGAKPLEDPTMMTGMKMLGKDMYRKYKPVNPATRFSFYLAFKISPQEQLAIEEYYNDVKFDLKGDTTRFVVLPMYTN